MVTGGIGDAKSFYCPSAGGLAWTFAVDIGTPGNDPADGYQGWELTKLPRMNIPSAFAIWNSTRPCYDTNNSPYYLGPQNSSIRDWLAAGGVDKNTLLTGDWRPILRSAGNSGYEVFTEYAYRNQPIGMHNVGGSAYNGPKSPQGMPITIVFTSPKTVSNINCPPFKTVRRLAGRALASDMFHKSGMWSKPGAGAKVHRDGYNVLYGTYTAQWYGDAEARIMWWINPLCYEGEYLGYTHGGLGCSSKYVYGEGGYWSGSGTNPGYYGRNTRLDPEVYHMFDQFIGLDLNVGPENWNYGP
jgi:hypothetical protein